ncbi:TetR/AcrR family transcriptional regulator [Spongiibacter nanhainus]|uniref:TetR/AcrR family transcriptional regulator n=1 Tax=Spongiibacter nanhainus TaxID=2794344 RepID=A0A7T4R0D8_9GAMM|nr:TetR/AcrR family transcriptional regulator [Spongiibacter nanhainus]QQD17999.1 TetR/AcrR family transcriptional regulator [Spongiibacter nanhainus]
MGRTRRFDEGAALEQATELFWRRGYAATTYPILEAQTGISGRSLIHCFGDKEALFLKVLKKYSADVGERLAKQGYRGSKSIVAFFQSLAEAPADSPLNGGCLMVNTLGELGTVPVLEDAVRAFRAQLLAFFADNLRVDGIAKPQQKAELLLALLWGSSTQIRSSGSVTALKPVVSALKQTLSAWQQQATKT